ncbi:MAG: hypothetical protein ACYC3N_03580 [Halothiobacillus sp.]
MPHIHVTILGLQPEPAANNLKTTPPLQETAWQWPQPAQEARSNAEEHSPPAPSSSQGRGLGFIDHWDAKNHSHPGSGPGPDATSPIAEAMQCGRRRPMNGASSKTCPDDPEARLLVRFAPAATVSESARLALQADLATDATLQAALVQCPDLAAISRIEPVHLHAGTDHAIVMGLRYLALTDEEWQPLVHDLNQWLAQDGLTLFSAASGRHYLGYTPAALARMGADDLPPLGCALNRNAQPLLAGDALRGMRRWLTEVQMWLYAHPINAHRAARGRPEINSLWVWGRSSPVTNALSPELTPKLTAGPMNLALPTRHSNPVQPLIYTDSPHLAGELMTTQGPDAVVLAQSSHPRCDELPANVLNSARPLHLIWSEPAWCYLEGDMAGWVQALERIDDFLHCFSKRNTSALKITLDDGASQLWLPARQGLMALLPFSW